MSRILLPDARFRSPTAVPDKADMRDINVYSALVVQHGASGQSKVFTVPQGQAIPRLAGAGITAPTAQHQLIYSELTTNLTKAGELGSSLGDASVRAIAINIETAYMTQSGVNAGALNTYGAGQQEASEVSQKCFFQFKIAGKQQIEGPVWHFPSAGGLYGQAGTTGTGQSYGVMSNGFPGQWRKLKLPILIARTDTTEGVFGVAGSASLTFSVTTGIGQPCLVWFTLLTLVKGDVR